jgi:hypothetical protein
LLKTQVFDPFTKLLKILEFVIEYVGEGFLKEREEAMANCPKCNKPVPWYKFIIHTRWTGVR